MTDDLMMIQHNPAVRDMLKYSFVGRPEAVKKQLAKFLEETGVDEIMAVSTIHGHQDRLKSYTLLADIMKDL